MADAPTDRHARHAHAPLLESALAFAERRHAPFYSPGHKGGRTLPRALRERIAELDLNNLPDTDTLHCPNGPILEAERLVADAWGTDRSFLLVGGSTSGNIAAILSAFGPGDRVLVQRNAHKSVVAGLVHSGAVPVWLPPAYDEAFGVALGLSAAQVDDAFRAAPDARGVIVLHPTYFGTTSDIAAIARVCRAHGKLLLADEAHGAHFHFHPDLPTAAEDAGADAVVQSTHKILSAMSQAAVLHTSGAALDEARVRKVLQLVQTTSPHFAIMASIDTARREMVLDGARLLGEALARARHARTELGRIPGVEVLGRAHLRGEGSGFHELDETKLTLRVEGLGITGYELQRVLNREHGVQPELGGTSHLLCILTIGNTDEDVERLVRGVRAVAKSQTERGGASGALPDGPSVRFDGAPPIAMSPRDAFYAKAAVCPFAAAEGRVSADVVTPYPPGIPVLMPGERVTKDILDGLAGVLAAGCPVSASDPSLATLRVVA